MLYIVINVFIGGPLENQLVEGQPSLKELNMKYMNIYGGNLVVKFGVDRSREVDICLHSGQMFSFVQSSRGSSLRSDQITFSPKTDQSGAVVVFTSAFCCKV